MTDPTFTVGQRVSVDGFTGTIESLEGDEVEIRLEHGQGMTYCTRDELTGQADQPAGEPGGSSSDGAFATMTPIPAPDPPEGLLDGQRFFQVADREFHYGFDDHRRSAWEHAHSYALELGADVVEERTNQRLNDYVGPGVYGLCIDPATGEITSRLLSGDHHYGASIRVGSYLVTPVGP